jgi:hypothetical protein
MICKREELDIRIQRPNFRYVYFPRWKDEIVGWNGSALYRAPVVAIPAEEVIVIDVHHPGSRSSQVEYILSGEKQSFQDDHRLRTLGGSKPAKSAGV